METRDVKKNEKKNRFLRGWTTQVPTDEKELYHYNVQKYLQI